MTGIPNADQQAVWPVVPPLQAGLRCRCPRCGKGKLYKGLLDVAPACAVCGLDLTPHDSGDGPAVLVIFALGFLVVPLALGLESAFSPPIWVHLLIWPPVIIGLAIAMLRPMKAVLVAYHFKNLHHLYEAEHDQPPSC